MTYTSSEGHLGGGEFSSDSASIYSDVGRRGVGGAREDPQFVSQWDKLDEILPSALVINFFHSKSSSILHHHIWIHSPSIYVIIIFNIFMMIFTINKNWMTRPDHNFFILFTMVFAISIISINDQPLWQRSMCFYYYSIICHYHSIGWFPVCIVKCFSLFQDTLDAYIYYVFLCP